LFRKSQLALIAILVAALLGAFASSMIPASGFQLTNVTMEDIEGFTISADKMTITGGPPTMILVEATMDGTPVAAQNVSKVEIINMHLVKGNVEINATRVVGDDVFMKIMKVKAGNATFVDLTMTAIPEFTQSAGGTVTLIDVEITAVYMFAKRQTIYGMKLTVS